MQNNDLISRKALIAAYDAAHKGPPGGARKLMEEAPAVDAAPVVHGRWKTANDVYNWYGRCSECGIEFNIDSYYASRMKYCPHCGARMDARTCGPDYCEIGGETDG